MGKEFQDGVHSTPLCTFLPPKHGWSLDLWYSKKKSLFFTGVDSTYERQQKEEDLEHSRRQKNSSTSPENLE